MDLKLSTDLLERYLNGQCTPDEEKLVEVWYEALIENAEMPYSPEERKHFMGEARTRLLADIAGDPSLQPAVPVVHIKPKKHLIWWAAAACILVIGTLFFFQNNRPSPKNIVAKTDAVVEFAAPTSNKATITLSNGKVVYIDSMLNGEALTDSEVELIKLANGELQYRVKAGSINDALASNTLFNPRGSQVISIVLSDGTKVWLNAGSSLTYPLAFLPAERNVNITGEAFFEVAHNQKSPFTATANNTQIQVLGTAFNVNTNKSQISAAVTLFQGSVKVANKVGQSVLKPGQQALVGNSIQVLNDVDLSSVTAWKEGLFSFNETSFDEMMQEIGRWYNIEVVYANQIPARQFGGKISRTANLSEVLNILKESNVAFRIEAGKLIILK